MPQCSNCGVILDSSAAFCAKCGTAQPTPSGAPASGSAPPSTVNEAMPTETASPLGLRENVAASLCYILGWLTGAIFFLTDKRFYVRFHAAQSIVVFGGLNILRFLVSAFFGFGFLGIRWVGLPLVTSLLWLIDVVGLILWIVCMVKAYQGERFRVPIAADLAERIFRKL